MVGLLQRLLDFVLDLFKSSSMNVSPSFLAAKVNPLLRRFRVFTYREGRIEAITNAWVCLRHTRRLRIKIPLPSHRDF